MKKIIILLSFSLILLWNQRLSASPKKEDLSEQEQVRLVQLQSRVLEIKAMDKSHLSSVQRRALRKELYQIKSEMKGFTSGGVYLSVAAIIIIILVLILIL